MKNYAVVLVIIVVLIGGVFWYRDYQRASLVSEINDLFDETCIIKGNISSSGEKIYHTPDCLSYDKTIIDENNGEKMFCSEEGAIEAGWRKAKNCPIYDPERPKDPNAVSDNWSYDYRNKSE